MYDLRGKIALVTGTSSKKGIGHGVAVRLAEEGADVIVSDKYKSPKDIDPWDKKEGWRGLESLVSEIEAIGRRALAIHADLSNPQEVYGLVQKALERFGKIDILVNNAAVVTNDIGATPIVDLKEESWNKAIAVNLTGTFLMCKTVARHMIERGQGGKIVNIASIAGKRPNLNRAPYCSSKAGEIAFTQSLALELAPHKIYVNAVCPGLISTSGVARAISEAVNHGLSEEEAIARSYAGQIQQIPLGRLGKPEDIANLVAFLASNQSDYITGQAINVCGGRFMAR